LHGPKARAILVPWLRPELASSDLFSLPDAVAERRVALRAARKTKVQPSRQDRRMNRPKQV
jgi:hypothetical protein